MTTDLQITKKWRERSKLLRSIIHLGTNNFRIFNFKPFVADDHHDKVHDNKVDNTCMEDDKKLSNSVFYKVGLLPSLVRVPSRGLKKIGRAVSIRMHEVKDGEDGGLELCKKRIMMGRKCLPLNVSRALRYDKNGVLVPEDL